MLDAKVQLDPLVLPKNGGDIRGIVTLKESSEKVEKMPMRLMLAIDTSGSMDGSPLKNAVTAASFCVDMCSEEDKLGVMIFSNSTRYIATLKPMTAERKNQVKERLKCLVAGGGTNIYETLDSCLSIMEDEDYEPGKVVKCIFMLTDGEPTTQETNYGVIIADMTKKHPPSVFQSLYTFGFGSSARASGLSMLAERWNGMYFPISDGDAIKKSFANAQGGLATTQATNVRVVIEGTQNLQTLSAQTRFPTVLEERSLMVTIPTIESGEERTILFSGVLGAAAHPDGVSVSITYLTRDGEKMIHCDVLSRKAVEPEKNPSMDIEMARMRWVTTEALRESHRLAVERKFSDARSIVNNALVALRSSRVPEGGLGSLVADLETTLKELDHPERYEIYGAQRTLGAYTSHSTQRDNLGNDSYTTPTRNTYVNMSVGYDIA